MISDSDRVGAAINQQPGPITGVCWIPAPLPGEWECDLFGAGSGYVWRPARGRTPKAFTRFMMRVILDCHWRRVIK